MPPSSQSPSSSSSSHLDGRPASRTKALLFDFMGTCLDWHTSIIASLPKTLPKSTRSNLALTWRQTFFDSIAQRFASGLPPEDIDITHTNTLHAILERAEYAELAPLFTASAIATAVAAWHAQPAWPDVRGVLDACRARGWEVFVLANGTTRLQLDLVRASGLRFDMLFSSELLGVYKPAKQAYQRVLDLIGRGADEVVMVAAHAYDLRAAAEVGLRTVYVYRWTDDREEEQENLKLEFDVYLEDGLSRLPELVD